MKSSLLNPRTWARKSKLAKFVGRTVPTFYRLQKAGLDPANFKNLRKISKILKLFPGKISEEALFNYLLYSKSEIDQELIAFLLVGPNGYFVEFGACDGMLGSNSYFLEKTQGWKGVLSEPIPYWYNQIRESRSADAYPFAIAGFTQEKAEFVEPTSRGLSTLRGYENSDRHSSLRADGKIYVVETITLRELLRLANSPRHIDYLSVDTEGSELDILMNFPFHEFTFSFVSIEHNHSENRKALKEFMNSKGYREILPEFSGGEWWFVPSS